MKRVLYLSLALSFCAFGLTAQNSVPNPGFETYSACPTSVAQIANATPWAIPVGHTGSPDFIHVCGGGLVDVPNNAFGSQNAYGGSGYLGWALIYNSFPGFREYAMTPLVPALTAGTTYRVSMYVSLADNSQLGTDRLQFYFSTTAPTWVNNWNPMTTYTPQAAIPTGSYITNKTGWTQYTANYTATGGESFLTIGNFMTDAQTTTVAAGGGSAAYCYIYIDDAVVEPDLILSANIADLAATEVSGDVRVSWATENEIATDRFEIERNVGEDVEWATIGTKAAAGNFTGRLAYTFMDRNAQKGMVNRYRLRLVDLNGDAHYTNAVSVIPDPGEDRLIQLGPNPLSQGEAMNLLFFADAEKDLTVTVMNLSGQVILEERVTAQAGAHRIDLPTHALSKGHYLLRVRSEQEVAVERIVVQ